VGWNDQLVSFIARLLAEPTDDGELVDVPELVERMKPRTRMSSWAPP
jgi:hypothetical protein